MVSNDRSKGYLEMQGTKALISYQLTDVDPTMLEVVENEISAEALLSPSAPTEGMD